MAYGIIATSGDYDFTTKQLQTNTDQDTGSETRISSSYSFENHEIENNLIVFKFCSKTLVVVRRT